MIGEESGLKAFVEARLTELGRGPFEAAKIGGLQRNFVRDIIRDRKKSIRGESIGKLAKALDLVPEELAAALAGAPRLAPSRRASEAVPAPGVALPAEMPKDVPVRGLASASVVVRLGIRGAEVEGFSFEERAIDQVRRPPALVGVPEAYALYVTGDSMSPAHPAGELRFVHPGRPIRAGDTVLILTRAGDGRPLEAFVKRFLGWRNGDAVAEQINPPAVIEFKAPTVVGVHKILSMNELFGV